MKPQFTFDEHTLLSNVLHLCCHLLWNRGQVGGLLLPTGQVQRLCHRPGSSCLILNVGLNELRGGVRDGFIRGRGVAIWTRVAHAGVGKHFNLTELVSEVHVAVNGRLRAALGVFSVVPVIGDAISWKEGIKQSSSNAYVGLNFIAVI